MEYIFTNLPQYIRVTSRSEFSSSVVHSGSVLLFSEDGTSLTAKLSDGSFITVGGSGTDVSDTTATAANVQSGYYFYNSAGVKTAGTLTVSGGVDVSDTTATAAMVLSGAIFHDSTGAVTTGTIPTVSGGTITPTTSNQIISSGVYLGGSQTILGDAALASSNIRSGASIFGVSGKSTVVDVSDTTATPATVQNGALFYDSTGELAEGNMPFTLGGTITPTTSMQVFSGGLFLAGDVEVEGDPALVASNIVSGVSIFGVSGTYTGSSGGADVILGYVSSGIFYELAFSGTSSVEVASSAGLSNYAWNLPVSSGSSGGSITSGVAIDYYGDVVSSADSMTSKSLDFGYRMIVYSGGTATSTTVNSRGYMGVYSGGTANSTTVNYGGELFISVGIATDITENGGAVWVNNGTASFTPNTFSGLSTSSSVTVHSGTTAIDTNISGLMYVYSGGIANGTAVNSWAFLYLFGGTANIADVKSAGNIYVYSGTASNTTVSSGGSLVVESGGTANSATVNGGDIVVSAAGTANNITISGGSLYVSTSGTANNITISHGTFSIHGGRASNTVVDYGAEFKLLYGTATSVTVNSSGTLQIFSGGTALAVTSSAGANIIVSSGGYIEYVNS